MVKCYNSKSNRLGGRHISAIFLTFADYVLRAYNGRKSPFAPKAKESRRMRCSVVCLFFLIGFFTLPGVGPTARGAENNAKKTYDAMRALYPEDRQGWGVDSFQEAVDHQPMTYGLVLSAEAIRLQNDLNDESRRRVEKATRWLLENQDLDKDGKPGWGLPQPWDAWADGTTNPPNHPYTITTAICLEGLLDALAVSSASDNIPRDEIRNLMKQVVLRWCREVWSEGYGGGYFWYSPNPADDVFGVNAASWFLGSMTRLLSEHGDVFSDAERKLVRNRADALAKAIAQTVQLREGRPFWKYAPEPNRFNHDRPNDLVHHIYILWGIETYRDAGPRVKLPWTRAQAIESVDCFWRDGRMCAFPQDQKETTSLESKCKPPRLWSAGMMLAFYARWGSHRQAARTFEAIGEALGPWPKLRLRPREAGGSDTFYPRHGAHALMGLARHAFRGSDPPKPSSWSYRDWKPGGERTTLDGMTFDSTIHCGGGQDFVKVGPDHYRFRARVAQRRYAWRFYFKIECPESRIGSTITLEVADLNHGGRQLWQEAANVYSEDGTTWLPVGLENTKIVPWTPTKHAAEEKKYGDAGHIPYGVQFRLTLTRPVMWFAGPTPYTLERRDRLFARIKRERPAWVEISKVGDSRHSSRHGHPITMARITAPGDAAGRENVMVIAGEHCSEVAGIYACEGWIEEVLSHPKWLEKYVFYFIPIVNVDGVYYGATYYNMPSPLAKGVGVNLSSNWPKRTEPEIQALWGLVTKLRPIFFASLHNGRHRKTLEAFGVDTPENRAMLAAWRKEVEFTIDPLRSAHGKSTRVWGVLGREGITSRAFTIETLLLRRMEGHETSQTSYLELGRQLARGTIRGLAAPR